MTDRTNMALVVLLFLCALALISTPPEGSTYDPLGEGVECARCGRHFYWDDSEYIRDFGRDFCSPECAEDFLRQWEESVDTLTETGVI